MCTRRIEDVIDLFVSEKPETIKHFATIIEQLARMNYLDVTVEDLHGLLLDACKD